MNRDDHLDSGSLAKAAVDPNLLGAGERGHLEGCEVCKSELRDLEAGLAALGQRARQMSPEPPPLSKLELPRQRPVALGAWLWRAPAAACLAAAAVFLLVFAGPTEKATQTGGPMASLVLEEPLFEDQSTLSALGVAEVEVFTPFQNFLVGGQSVSMEQEFMDFAAPAHDEGLTWRKRGGASCVRFG